MCKVIEMTMEDLECRLPDGYAIVSDLGEIAIERESDGVIVATWANDSVVFDRGVDSIF